MSDYLTAGRITPATFTWAISNYDLHDLLFEALQLTEDSALWDFESFERWLNEYCEDYVEVLVSRYSWDTSGDWYTRNRFADWITRVVGGDESALSEISPGLVLSVLATYDLIPTGVYRVSWGAN